MNRLKLIQTIKEKKSFLCVGLDPDLDKIPEHLQDEEDPVFSFNQAIIEATEDLCVAYKPNIAFFESMGVKGWESLQKTWAVLPKNCLSIADAKRGDIGNTSRMYAKTFFDETAAGMSFDALTIAPYMGRDSIKPFMEYANKWTIVLALTSNEGSADFQWIEGQENGLMLFEQVIQQVNQWGSPNNLMYVVGATRGAMLKTVRQHAPDHFLLVPGVGAQGGSLEEVCKYGLTKDVGLLINATRSIIYASSGKDFAERAREEALRIQQQMARILEEHDATA